MFAWCWVHLRLNTWDSGSSRAMDSCGNKLQREKMFRNKQRLFVCVSEFLTSMTSNWPRLMANLKVGRLNRTFIHGQLLLITLPQFATLPRHDKWPGKWNIYVGQSLIMIRWYAYCLVCTTELVCILKDNDSGCLNRQYILNPHQLRCLSQLSSNDASYFCVLWFRHLLYSQYVKCVVLIICWKSSSGEYNIQRPGMEPPNSVLSWYFWHPCRSQGESQNIEASE